MRPLLIKRIQWNNTKVVFRNTARDRRRNLRNRVCHDRRSNPPKVQRKLLKLLRRTPQKENPYRKKPQGQYSSRKTKGWVASRDKAIKELPKYFSTSEESQEMRDDIVYGFGDDATVGDEFDANRFSVFFQNICEINLQQGMRK